MRILPPADSALKARYAPIPEFLPAFENHLLSGPSGAGKTTLAAFMAAAIQQGEPLFGHPTQKPPFIGIIFGDRTEDDAVAKLQRAGCGSLPRFSVVDDLDDLTTRYLVNNLGTARGADFSLLERCLDRLGGGAPLPPGALVFVDGFQTLCNVDPMGNPLRDIARPLIILSGICAKQQLTLICLHQAGKQKADKAQRYVREQDMVLGSINLQAYTSTQMMLVEPDIGDGTHWRLLISAHGAKRERHNFLRNENGSFRWVGKVEEKKVVEKVTGPTNDLYLELIPAPPDTVSSTELMRTAKERWGHERAWVYRVLKRLRDDGLIEGDGQGRWCRMVDGGDPAADLTVVLEKEKGEEGA